MPSKVTQTTPADAFPDDNFKYSPLERVRTLFVGFIQGLFRAAPTGAYHWEADDDTTEIVITDESPVHVQNIGQRPAVTVTRGPVQFYTLGLDDMLSYNAETGAKRKSVLVPGTMSVNAISRVPLECERLAWIIAEQLWANRELLLRAGFFEVGRQPAIGSPTPAGSLVGNDMADEYFATTVSCPFQFYRTTTVTPLGKKIISSIEMSMRARLNPIRTGAPLDSGGAELPVEITSVRPGHFSSASDAAGGTPSPGAEQQCPVLTAPHPLNPAMTVTIRGVRPNQPGLRAPSIGGRAIPLLRPCVPVSPSETATTKVKV